jgi:hypothetical protein
MSDNQQPTALVARRRDDRDRCIEALQIANAKGPGNLDVPALRRLLDFDKSEFAIVPFLYRARGAPNTRGGRCHLANINGLHLCTA